MQGATKERWVSLCEQAAIEQDPERLMKLITEIDRLLSEKDREHLENKRANSKTTGQIFK